jgi:hypothetical protein
MTEEKTLELLLYVLDWIKLRHGDVFGALLDDVPSAAVILADRSAAEAKAAQLAQEGK